MASTFVNGRNIAANGIRQHVLRYGGIGGGRDQRDTVRLVPGITSPAITWGYVGERLGQHFDTYVLDVRGRGLSSAGDELDYCLQAQIDDVTALVQARGLVLIREQLLEKVWGYTFLGDSRTIDVHVRQLRRKLGDACPIETVWGTGYKVPARR